MKKKTKLTPYLYVIPGLLMVLSFVYIPIIVNLVYSFFRLSSYSSSMKFVGLDNFRRLFTNDTFPIMMRNNVYYCVISLIVQVGFGTFLAFLLESRLASDRFKSICRNIYFLPALVSLTAVGMMFNFIYNPQLGLLNTFLKHIGLASMQQTWLGDKNLAIFCIIAMSQWQFTGYITLLMVVAFQKHYPSPCKGTADCLLHYHCDRCIQAVYRGLLHHCRWSWKCFPGTWLIPVSERILT